MKINWFSIPLGMATDVSVVAGVNDQKLNGLRGLQQDPRVLFNTAEALRPAGGLEVTLSISNISFCRSLWLFPAFARIRCVIWTVRNPFAQME